MSSLVDIGRAEASVRPVGIIGAMDLEVELLHEALEGTATRVIGAAEYASGTIDGTPCVIVQCGVGMVNAAACTQALMDHYALSCVINTGVAGSLSASLGVGDIVVATDAVNWTMDVQNLGYAPGQTPGLPSPFMGTSDALREAAKRAAQAEGALIHEGRVASGDKFVRDVEDRARIARTFDALCCEMEGAAVAQVCQANDVPCIIIRAISDNADGTDAVDYPVFEAAAARQCAALTRRLLSNIEPERSGQTL